MRQVQIDEFGGPEVLHVADMLDPRPGLGQVVARGVAAGMMTVAACGPAPSDRLGHHRYVKPESVT
jgi:hypothetical protein